MHFLTQAQKAKKNLILKNILYFLIFREMELSSPKIKKILIFREMEVPKKSFLQFRRQLSRLEK